MKPQFHFEQKKFEALVPKQQHKKCAELLRHVYSTFTPSTFQRVELEEYKKMTQWMHLNLPTLTTQEELASRFHFHRTHADISVKEHNLLQKPEPLQVTTTDKDTGLEFLSIDIYLDHLRSTHNIGSIIRTTEALRLGSLFFSNEMAAPSHIQVQNTSMGASRWVTCAQDRSLDSLKRPIIALETIPDATPYYEFTFPDAFTLVVGNEELGCSKASLAIADYYIQIPLYGRKNSLNVATAFAIVAAEIVKQKQQRLRNDQN
jgi:tRNA G18 (ribose-2'-O)-methylase SpoU